MAVLFRPLSFIHSITTIKKHKDEMSFLTYALVLYSFIPSLNSDITPNSEIKQSNLHDPLICFRFSSSSSKFTAREHALWNYAKLVTRLVYSVPLNSLTDASSFFLVPERKIILAFFQVFPQSVASISAWPITAAPEVKSTEHSVLQSCRACILHCLSDHSWGKETSNSTEVKRLRNF